jgi:hypothetical protein
MFEKKYFLENLNISENNIISVELVHVLWYRLGHMEIPLACC